MLNIEQKEILISINQYMSNFINSIPNIVEAYRIIDTEKISEYTLQLVDGFQWLNEALNLTSNIHDISMNEIGDILKELLSSIENKDTILTADLLEFELKAKLEEWEENISKILKNN